MSGFVFGLMTSAITPGAEITPEATTSTGCAERSIRDAVISSV
jgi:hypothetical protein